jgi:hypothetical protein
LRAIERSSNVGDEPGFLVQGHEHLGRALRAADDDRPQRLARAGQPDRRTDPGAELGAVHDALGRQPAEDVRHVGVAAAADDQVAAEDRVAVGQRDGEAEHLARLRVDRQDPLGAGVVAHPDLLQRIGHPLQVRRDLPAERVERAEVDELVELAALVHEVEEGEAAARVAQGHQVLHVRHLAARPRQHQVALPLHVFVLFEDHRGAGHAGPPALLEGHGQRQVRRAGPDHQDIHFVDGHVCSSFRIDVRPVVSEKQG